jgi:hypothetical protein
MVEMVISMKAVSIITSSPSSVAWLSQVVGGLVRGKGKEGISRGKLKVKLDQLLEEPVCTYCTDLRAWDREPQKRLKILSHIVELLSKKDSSPA